jgi:hypothetical protein
MNQNGYCPRYPVEKFNPPPGCPTLARSWKIERSEDPPSSQSNPTNPRRSNAVKRVGGDEEKENERVRERQPAARYMANFFLSLLLGDSRKAVLSSSSSRGVETRMDHERDVGESKATVGNWVMKSALCGVGARGPKKKKTVRRARAPACCPYNDAASPSKAERRGDPVTRRW